MSNDDADDKATETRTNGDGAETLGGDLERTEQASAHEIEQLVKASVDEEEEAALAAKRSSPPGAGDGASPANATRAIDDEDTATGDPEAIEKAILASRGEEDAPPSSEPMPVSARDVEPTSGRTEIEPISVRDADAEPLSLRDIEAEPVSMRDLEIAMAPGKAPPKLPVRPPPAPIQVQAPPARAIPRAPLKKRPVPAEGEAEGSAPSSPLPPPPGRSSSPPPARTPSVPPPLPARAASVPPPMPKRPSSIPPPLPPPARADREDDEIQALHGGLVGSLGMPPAPKDLGPPMSVDAEPESMGPDSLEGPTSQPAKKRKKKKRKSIAFDEPMREAAKEGNALGLATSPSAARVRVKSTQPSDDDAVSARADSDPPPPLAASRTAAKATTSSAAATPAKKRIERPIAPPPPAPAESSTGSKLMWAVGGAAIALIVGYVAFGRPSQPTQTEARSQEQHASVGPAPTPTEPKPAETTKTEEPAPTPADTASAAMPPGPAPSASVVASVPAPSAVGTVPTAPTVPGTAPVGAPTTPATAPPAPSASAAPTAEPSAAPPAGPEFDRGAASAALDSAVGAASGCKKEGDPSGSARVSVTFAPSGRVTVANIMGPPFAGTATGGCIAMSFRSATVPPFEGNPVTVTKTVNIP
jgi:hypothetical protein